MDLGLQRLTGIQQETRTLGLGVGPIVCYKCGQLGHIAQNCGNKPQKLWCRPNHCRTSTHNDSACRRTGKREKVNRVVTESDETEHSFVFRANMYEDDQNSMKTDMLLVDCGATSHILI